MATPTTVDNVLVFDANGEAHTDAVTVRAIYLYATGECTATLSDNTNEILKMRAQNEGSSLVFPGGHRFPSGLKLDSITGSVSGVVYVFVQ